MKSQSQLVLSLKAQIASTLKLIALKIKRYVLQLLELEQKLEVAMSKQINEIQVQHNNKVFSISATPGIYKVEDPSCAWGGSFYVAHDGLQALYLPGSAPKTNDLSQLDWRMAKKIENAKVKVGR